MTPSIAIGIVDLTAVYHRFATASKQPRMHSKIGGVYLENGKIYPDVQCDEASVANGTKDRVIWFCSTNVQLESHACESRAEALVAEIHFVELGNVVKRCLGESTSSDAKHNGQENSWCRPSQESPGRDCSNRQR